MATTDTNYTHEELKKKRKKEIPKKIKVECNFSQKAQSSVDWHISVLLDLVYPGSAWYG